MQKMPLEIGNQFACTIGNYVCARHGVRLSPIIVWDLQKKGVDLNSLPPKTLG